MAGLSRKGQGQVRPYPLIVGVDHHVQITVPSEHFEEARRESLLLWFGWGFELRDPFGNRLELIEALPQSPQFTKENRDGSAGNQ